jgi:xanthine dehydrogenase accessory factor
LDDSGAQDGTTAGAGTAVARFDRDGAPRDAITTARRWLDAYGTVALATVIKTWGSAPVPVGGHLVVARDERFEGSVSGGCVEAAVISEAANVMASGQPKCLEFGVADETAWGAGLPCGGRIEIFVERLSGPDDAAYLDAVLAQRRARGMLVIETDLASGRRRVHQDTAPFAEETAAQLAGGDSVLVDEPGRRLFLHARVAPVHVIVVGAGHVGQVLADLAQRVGFTVTVVDPRSGFSSVERFAGVPLRHEWPEEALPALGLDALTAVVTLAHEARLDDETLLAALYSPAFYVGALGSRRTHEKRLARLRKAGVSDAQIARIDAPVGLAIGAKGPAEIAVSILGAIIRSRRMPVPRPQPMEA